MVTITNSQLHHATKEPLKDRNVDLPHIVMENGFLHGEASLWRYPFVYSTEQGPYSRTKQGTIKGKSLKYHTFASILIPPKIAGIQSLSRSGLLDPFFGNSDLSISEVLRGYQSTSHSAKSQ